MFGGYLPVEVQAENSYFKTVGQLTAQREEMYKIEIEIKQVSYTF